MGAKTADIAILGGGLAGGLVALALARWRRDLSLLLVEEADHFGGDQVWTCLGGEIGRGGRALLSPLVGSGWRGWSARFPGFERTYPDAVYSVPAARLDAALRRSLPREAVLTGARAVACSATGASLADGTRIGARAVIDARGLRNASAFTGCWSRSLGRRLGLEAAHGLDRPLLVDGTVSQADGPCAVSCLPLADDEVLVTATSHGTHPTLPGATLAARIDDYARGRGWRVAEARDLTQAVRPVIDGGNFDTFWRSGGGESARAGMRAGLFHPLTGATLAEAVRWALALVRRADLDGAALARFSREWAERHWHRTRFIRRLAAMMGATAGADRGMAVLAAAHRLDPAAVARLHSGRLTAGDLARAIPRTPLPWLTALGLLAGRHAGTPLHAGGLT